MFEILIYDLDKSGVADAIIRYATTAERDRSSWNISRAAFIDTAFTLHQPSATTSTAQHHESLMCNIIHCFLQHHLIIISIYSSVAMLHNLFMFQQIYIILYYTQFMSIMIIFMTIFRFPSFIFVLHGDQIQRIAIPSMPASQELSLWTQEFLRSEL